MEMPLRDLNTHVTHRLECVTLRLKDAECARKANLEKLAIEEMKGMNGITNDRVKKMEMTSEF